MQFDEDLVKPEANTSSGIYSALRRLTIRSLEACQSREVWAKIYGIDLKFDGYIDSTAQTKYPRNTTPISKHRSFSRLHDNAQFEWMLPRATGKVERL